MHAWALALHVKGTLAGIFADSSFSSPFSSSSLSLSSSSLSSSSGVRAFGSHAQCRDISSYCNIFRHPAAHDPELGLAVMLT